MAIKISPFLTVRLSMEAPWKLSPGLPKINSPSTAAKISLRLKPAKSILSPIQCLFFPSLVECLIIALNYRHCEEPKATKQSCRRLLRSLRSLAMTFLNISRTFLNRLTIVKIYLFILKYLIILVALAGNKDGFPEKRIPQSVGDSFFAVQNNLVFLIFNPASNLPGYILRLLTTGIIRGYNYSI